MKPAPSEWTNPVNWTSIAPITGQLQYSITTRKVGTEWVSLLLPGTSFQPRKQCNSQDPSVRILNWADVTGATGYKVKAGTTTGASDLVNNETVAISQYTHTANWPYSTQIFWTVTVLNGAQEIAGTEWNFTHWCKSYFYPPFLEAFATVPPTNWSRFSGNLASSFSSDYHYIWLDSRWLRQCWHHWLCEIKHLWYILQVLVCHSSDWSRWRCKAQRIQSGIWPCSYSLCRNCCSRYNRYWWQIRRHHLYRWWQHFWLASNTLMLWTMPVLLMYITTLQLPDSMWLSIFHPIRVQ